MLFIVGNVVSAKGRMMATEIVMKDDFIMTESYYWKQIRLVDMHRSME